MKKRRLQWPEIVDRSDGEVPTSLPTRLLWMAGIWVGSIGILGAVAMVVRWVLKV